ncbi:MAG: hypothetical protein IJN03_02195 [Bacilli bacterium]|nr:hypothetical protein [Bacilli bacterium]
MMNKKELINGHNALLKELGEKIDDLNLRIRNVGITIEQYEYQKNFFVEDLEERKKEKYVLENYSKIIMITKIKHILKFLLKLALAGVVISIPMIALKLYPLLIIWVSLAVILAEQEIKSYDKSVHETKKIKHIYDEGNYNIDDYISDEKAIIKELDGFISQNTKRLTEIKTELNETVARKNQVSSELSDLLCEDVLTEQQEEKQKEEDRLALERTIKHGENVRGSSK